MKRIMTIMLCSVPLALGSAVYAQGSKGPTGSGSQSAASQAESTHPSALGGGNHQSSDNVQPTPRTPPEPTTANRPVDSDTGTNRSASGDDSGVPESNRPEAGSTSTGSGSATETKSK